MGFENAIFLYLMLPPLGILAYFVLSGVSGYEKYFSASVLDKILIQGDTLGTKGRNTLILLALFLFIIALARPIMNQKELKVQTHSKNLIIAIDISRSMRANDIYPNRLEFVKNKLNTLIDGLKETNIGIIAFARNAFLVSPLTSDKKSLKFLLSYLDSDIVSVQGTNIANALSQTAKMFVKGGVRDVFLISDGGEREDVKKAIDEAKRHELKVSVMVVGSGKGGSVRLENGELLKDRSGRIVITKRNESLKELALKSGGVYIKEFGGGGGVKLLENSLKEEKNKQTKSIKTAHELFMYPLVLGFVFLFISLHGRAKKGLFAFFALFFMMQPNLKAGLLDFIYIHKAKQAIEHKQYQQAIEEYNKLSSSPSINYNKANAYYKMKKYDEALHEYKKVKTTDKTLKTKALFNEGNAYVQKQAYPNALKAYEEAKKLSPNDKDIDKNIAYVKKKMQEKKQSKEGKKKQNKKQKKDKQGTQEESWRNKEDKQSYNEKDKSEENKKQKQEGKKKQSKQKQQSFDDTDESLEEKEAKKWERMIKDKAFKTQPIRLGKKKGEEDGITW